MFLFVVPVAVVFVVVVIAVAGGAALWPVSISFPCFVYQFLTASISFLIFCDFSPSVSIGWSMVSKSS